jgi:hypothetical protein
MMVHEPELPAVLADVEMIDATAEDVAAIAEALEDLGAGRYVVCDSTASFEALLAELAAPPKAS